MSNLPLFSAVVVAGSHKINHDSEALVAAAYEERSLIHQVVAPAGSALVFTESLLHATGHNRSNRERAIMIAGFGTTYFPWKYMESHRPDFQLDPEFLRNVPASVRHMYESKGYITRQRRYRTLAEQRDELHRDPPKWPYARI